jgi:hypothetical protein
MSRESTITLAHAAEGGCLCGAVRYRVEAGDGDSGYCHCRTCQRSAGAPVLAWLTVPLARFKFTGVAPTPYRSSDHAQREFCNRCGTQVLFRDDKGEKVDVNSATLDDPSVAPPRYHIWRMSRIAWFETADTLPRFDDSGIDV